MKKFYLTTPIYYVNDEPHIGHLYTTIIADIISRYYKLLGIDTFFLTGTDEHGAKIYEVAKKNNYEPKQYCDFIVEKFKNVWEEFCIEYSNFIRTTDKLHEDTVKLILQKLFDNGDIYKAYYEGLYCVQCERFISEDELVDGVCPDHLTKPILHKEENYFFKISKYKTIIFEKIQNGEIQIIPETRKNEILGKLQLSVEDISISRKTLRWGIPLPFDEQQTTYVWIDALINYLSGIDYFNLVKRNCSYFWPCDLHIIGKDILWFHSVIWPAILLSLGLSLPKKILAHGFFTVKGKKMSKTLGNIIRPKELKDLFGIDAARSLVISAFPLDTDGDISINEMIQRYNQLLADNLGNLVNRTFGMLEKYFNNQLMVSEISSNVKEVIISTVSSYKKCFEKLDIHGILNIVLTISSFANKYVQDMQPWSLFKNKEIQKLTNVISDLLYCIKSVVLLCYPLMPNVCKKILACFNEEEFIVEDFKTLVKENIVYIRSKEFKSPGILFKKIK